VIPELSLEVVVLVAGPEVAFEVAELSLEVVVLVAGPEVAFVVAELSLEVVVLVAGHEVAFAVADLSPEVVVLVAGLEVAFVVADLSLQFAVFSVADAAEPQASVDIAVAFVVLVPVSVVVAELDSSGCPRFLAFPNVDHFSSSSSSVEVVG
jgi:hypothetical protein